MLHVVQSIAQRYGGPTQSLAGYVAASRKAGIQVTIATPRCSKDDLDAFRKRAGNVEIHFFRAVGRGAFSVAPTLVRWVRHSTKQFDVVEVHGLWSPISSLSARAVVRSGGVLVIRPFGTLSRYTVRHRRSLLKHAYFRLIERSNLHAAAALHFTTETERKEADWHGIDFSGRSHVIPPPAPEAHRRVDMDGEAPNGATVVFIGRINPVKNLEALLDAWLFVRRKLPEAILQIAGEGDSLYLASLRHRASINGISSSVSFPGFVSGSQKDELLRSAALLVLPSHHENFGVVVLEALEAGVPVIVSPDVHLSEFVRNEGVGKVAAANPAIFADAIVDVLSDEEMKTRVREHGADIVARNFSPSAIGELLSKMYQDAVELSRGAA